MSKIPREGSQVSGKYFGVPFSGVVESARPNYMWNGEQIFHVRLDAPITVFDDERNAIAVTVNVQTLTSPESCIQETVDALTEYYQDKQMSGQPPAMPR
jgi:hypothetical protein